MSRNSEPPVKAYFRGGGRRNAMTTRTIQAVKEWFSKSENADAEWLLGDALRERMLHADYLDNPAIQVIAREQGGPLAAVIKAVRGYTTNPDDLRKKLAQELNPKTPDFDSRIEDFLAELVGVLYLSKCGFKDFEFLLPTDLPMPDLRARHQDNGVHFVEIKNLREPNSPTTAAFRRWHRKQIEEPEKFCFTASIDFHTQIEPDLDQTQVKAVNDLVDSLPSRKRPSEFPATLPGRLELSVKVEDGNPVMLSYGAGGALDKVRDARAKTFLVKVLDQTAKGLRQLYGPHLGDEAGRLLLLRWRVPSDTWLVADEVRGAVRKSLEDFLRPYFPKLGVHILNNTDQLEA
jgi:hypothetical protein